MPRIKGVDVNPGAFKGIKSLDALKKEPGRIFGHLSEEEESAAYDELGAALGLKPSAPKTVEAQPQPATSGQ